MWWLVNKLQNSGCVKAGNATKAHGNLTGQSDEMHASKA